MMAKWDEYPNFKKSEFDCKDTGENAMTHEFMVKLQLLREKCGFTFVITSGFRSVKHSVEVKKTRGGTHTKGLACDIRANGSQAYEIVHQALKLGFTGVGVHRGFVHLDIATKKDGFDRPWLWPY